MVFVSVLKLGIERKIPIPWNLESPSCKTTCFLDNEPIPNVLFSQQITDDCLFLWNHGYRRQRWQAKDSEDWEEWLSGDHCSRSEVFFFTKLGDLWWDVTPWVYEKMTRKWRCHMTVTEPGQKNVHGRIDANMWMLNQELNIPYYNIHDTINWFINTYTVHIYMPVIVIVYVWETVFDHIDHIFGFEIAKFQVEKKMELNEQIFWATALNILKFGGARDDTGYQGCTQASLLQRGWLPPFWTKYLLIWIHYYTVSLLSLQIILNDVYIQRRGEMFCMIFKAP